MGVSIRRLVYLCLAVQCVINQLGVVAQFLEAGDSAQHARGLAAGQQPPRGVTQQEVLVQGLLQGGQLAAHHLHNLWGQGAWPAMDTAAQPV